MVEGGRKIKALVDTGYNGYLTLPYSEAFPLGLVLMGIESSKIADGSTTHHFVCFGRAKIKKEVPIIIDIQPECNILIGTKLLKRLNKKAIIDFAKETINFLDSG